MLNPFRRVMPTPDQAATMAGLGRKLHSTYEDLCANLPDGPYKVEALMHLEKVGMLANKAITHGTPDKE